MFKCVKIDFLWLLLGAVGEIYLLHKLNKEEWMRQREKLEQGVVLYCWNNAEVHSFLLESSMRYCNGRKMRKFIKIITLCAGEKFSL